MAALFGSGSTRQGKKNLLEIKAGKMYLKGKMCHPDKRKGLIYIHQTEDSLMHFCWKERGTGKQPDDVSRIIHSRHYSLSSTHFCIVILFQLA